MNVNQTLIKLGSENVSKNPINLAFWTSENWINARLIDVRKFQVSMHLFSGSGILHVFRKNGRRFLCEFLHPGTTFLVRYRQGFMKVTNQSSMFFDCLPRAVVSVPL